MDSIFSPAELEFLKNQRLCRIATTGADGQPHVTPVAFRYNADSNTFDVGGHGSFANRKKWRDVTQNPRVALVFDELTLNPWHACGIEIRGTVETFMSGGDTIGSGFGPEMFRITPKRIVSWGLDNANPYAAMSARSVK